MSDHDPFNCPQCGAHDYGLFASSMLGCPHCLLAENTALTAKLEKANRDIEIECGAWADQVHALKVKLAAAEARVAELEEVIADYNTGLKLSCGRRNEYNAKAFGCEAYLSRGMQCPNCPMDDLIEMPSLRDAWESPNE